MADLFEQGSLDPAVVGRVPTPLEGEYSPPLYGDHDIERYVPEGPKRAGRSPFERDRARLVHASAMRRLGAKTQVLTAGTDDFSRTRLTHSLEVAQIGREIGRALGADPDVVDTACLAHDLGHPPFGHNGETALAEAAKDIGGFEGNAQTLRLLTRLEPKVIGPDGTPEGLNLTRASLDACTKYPWRFDDRPWTPAGKRSGKFGVYDDDLPVFTWLRDGAPPGRRSFEAQVMDLADDIAYSVHDVEDAVVSGRVDLAVLDSAEERARVVEATRDWYGPWNEAADLDAAFERLRAAGYLRGGYDGTRRGLAHLKDTTSQIIGRLSGAAERATIEAFGPGPHARYRSQLVVPDETSHEMLLLKGIAVTYVMAPRGREPVYGAQREILHDLVSALLDRGASALEASFSSDFQAAGDDAARLRVVIDQVASLTDLSAVVWHHRLLGTDRWTGEEIAASGFPWLGS